jgi:predicted ferric reductase
MGDMTSHLAWYIARSSGLVGWALLTASVILGLALSTRAGVAGRRPRPAWTLDLHRYLGGLAAIFTAVHVAGIVGDTYVGFGPADVLVPLASAWHPVAVAWGVVAMYLLVAVEATSLARKRLPRKVWRLVHFASFPLFLSATLHAVTAGTDTGTWVFEGVAVAASTLIAGLTVLRIRQATAPPAPGRPGPGPRVPAGPDAGRDLVRTGP